VFIPINPCIHPEATNRPRDVFFRDPFKSELDVYEKRGANDPHDFVAYCFALSHDVAIAEDNAVPGGVDEVHALREQFVETLVLFVEDYLAGKINVGEGYSYGGPVTVGDTEGGPWTTYEWAVEELQADVAVFALEIHEESTAPRTRRVLLHRDTLDAFSAKGVNTVKPLLEHYFYLNRVVTAVYKIRKLSAWCGEQELKSIEAILHHTWQVAVDTHGDINLLREQVELFHHIQNSARGGALNRALAGRS
jgi:hypothetical protein